MKKNNLFLLIAILSAGLICFNSCESTDQDETVISSIESNHVKVDVLKSNVKITLTKAEGENIEKIDIYETPNGSLTSVQMDESTVSFIWPFAEPDKEYILCAKIYGNSVSEEYVTFKTTEDTKQIINYSQAYNDSTIQLVAKGNKRYLTLEASADLFTSLGNKAKAQEVYFVLALYSGKHYKASEKDSVLVGKSVTSISSKDTIEKFRKGIDILEESYRFNLTPAELNTKLSKNKTYFAVATVYFELPDYPAGIKFTARGVYSNDTIYTPVNVNELPEAIDSSVASAK